MNFILCWEYPKWRPTVDDDLQWLNGHHPIDPTSTSLCIIACIHAYPKAEASMTHEGDNPHMTMLVSPGFPRNPNLKITRTDYM